LFHASIRRRQLNRLFPAAKPALYSGAPEGAAGAGPGALQPLPDKAISFGGRA
jgi:hypothetical protein